MTRDKVSAREASGRGAASITIAVPMPEAVTVVQAPPSLVSPDVGAEHVGLTRAGLVDVLRAMRADPRWAPCVIVLSRKRVAAAPEDVIAFMRERYSATAAPVGKRAEAPADGVDAVLAAAGCERVRRKGVP